MVVDSKNPNLPGANCHRTPSSSLGHTRNWRRRLVGDRAWHLELNLRAGTGLTPHVQLCAKGLRPFTDAPQPPMAGTPTIPQDLRIHTDAVIADAQAQLAILVSNLGFDLLGARMPEGIANE